MKPNLLDQVLNYMRTDGSVEGGIVSREHVDMYVENFEYRYAMIAANYPLIGTDAWADAAWKMVEDEGWSSLNAQERALARAHPREFINYGNASLEAIAEARALAQRRLGPDGVIRRDTTTGNGNDRDVFNAFQHSFWNANLTTRIGAERAKVWADAHESGLPNNSDNNWATQMDFFNNHVGREIGQLWRDNQQGFGITLAQLVENWLNNGQMRYICFDSYVSTQANKDNGTTFTNQRFRFTNQTCQ